ncbi:MAG: extracellular solute-binding protein [Puniceicoccales bacterium]|jgi:ABC-type Fe3+ transport system substrate-binding protein|nr:extracellular solute-binding protein [Puniceicoccales bacterium]
MPAIKRSLILSSIALVIAIPFIFHSPSDSLIPVENDDVLVIITPHNESLRREYSHGFQEWYRKKTGKSIVIDWRHPGGGCDVARYTNAMFVNNFRLYWESLGRTWTQEIRGIFLHLEKIDEHSSPLEQDVKNVFLSSHVGCNVDLLFGGGIFEHKLNGWKGYSVDSHLKEEHPELFTDDKIPEIFAGEQLYDDHRLWYGISLSSFGITYNADAIKELGIAHLPSTWMDMADPRYLGGIAIVDPSKSSSTLKSFETLIQQQMHQILKELLAASNPMVEESELENQAIQRGWIHGLQLIQRIVANGRYFTDSSGKPIIDVAAGNCPIGIAVDFYGRAQKANIKGRGGAQRFGYVAPEGGTAPSPDPISLFRGAKHREIAKAFMEYAISLPGQQLLAFKIGIPNGPIHSPLCRTPILKTVYGEEFRSSRLEGYEDPYSSAGDFIYRPAWTGPVYDFLGLIVKVAFIDAADELISAWSQIIRAQNEGHREEAEEALKIFSDMTLLTYNTVRTSFAEKIQHKNPLIAGRYQMDLTNKFRRQYQLAESKLKGL